MSYNATTDFVALLRNIGGSVRFTQMPGLDYALEALGRAGLISLYVGETAPTVNQSTTVWLQPASPSWNAEGQVFLRNGSAWVNATPTLWSELIAGPFIDLIPVAGNNAPLMDSNASVGVSAAYSRQDHVHPTDTTRAPLASPVLTGTPQAPTPTFGDNSTNIATTAFVQETAGVVVPIGGAIPFTGSSAPSSNFAIANGQAISRTTFANLFAIVGITYGSGDGVTTFNIPDLRGRVVAGVDGGANRLTTATMTSQALAGSGGVETIALTTSNMPTHNHTMTDPGHAHTNNAALASANGPASSGSLVFDNPATVNANSTGVSTQNNGSGTAHANVQPTMQLNYLVRVA